MLEAAPLEFDQRKPAAIIRVMNRCHKSSTRHDEAHDLKSVLILFKAEPPYIKNLKLKRWGASSGYRFLKIRVQSRIDTGAGE
jgi:hypothetical protein